MSTSALLGVTTTSQSSNSPSTVEALENPIASQQKYGKSWRLEDTKTPIRHMVLSVPGLTFVEPSPTLASDPEKQEGSLVRVTSDSEEILEALELVPCGEDSFELRVKPNNSIPSKMTGHLLTEVQLSHVNQVHQIDCSGSGNVIIQPGTFCVQNPEASLKLSLKGSGDVVWMEKLPVHVRSAKFEVCALGNLRVAIPELKTTEELALEAMSSGNLYVNTNQVEGKSLEASLTGSGDMELAAASVRPQSVNFKVVGSGDIKTRAQDFQVNTMNTSIVGSGDVHVQSNTLQAAHFYASVVGSGDMLVNASKCIASASEIEVKGSGDVQAPSLVSTLTQISIAGSGDVSVKEATRLEESGTGSGKISMGRVAPVEVNSSRAKSLVHRTQDISIPPDVKHSSATFEVPNKTDAFENTNVTGDMFHGKSFLGPIWSMFGF